MNSYILLQTDTNKSIHFVYLWIHQSQECSFVLFSLKGRLLWSSFDPFNPVDRDRFFVNSVDPDETAHYWPVSLGSTVFALPVLIYN